MLLAALPYFVYTTAHSVRALGIAVVSETVPALIFNTIGGAFADRLPRKLVMAVGDGLRGVVLLPMVLVHSPSTLWIVYVTGFASAAIAAFAGPFGTASLPHIVRLEDLPTANATFASATYTASLVGSPLGGILFQRFGISVVVIVDAISFLIPTIAISLINVPLEDRSVPVHGEPPRPHVITEWARGWSYAYRSSLLFRLFCVAMFVFFGNAIVGVVLVPFVRHVLHGSAEFYSLMLTLQAASGIGAGFLIGTANRRFGGRRLLGMSLVAVGLLDLLGAVVATKPMALFISATVSIPILFAASNLTTLLQTGSDDGYRGRVSGAYTSTIALVSLLGSTCATLVTDRVGIRLMFALGGLIFILSGVGALRAFGSQGGSARGERDNAGPERAVASTP
jgi:predicted MFS family arabinose efflux permease